MSGIERHSLTDTFSQDGMPIRNVALGKSATQSSTDVFSHHQDPALDAAGAVNGEITGGCGFHTGHQQSPWWQVDLGEPHIIHEVVVYNRVDTPALIERALPLEIRLSDDGIETRLSHLRETPFGGKDGAPLRWIPEGREQARFVRLLVPKEVCLHLDEVEIYGRRWDPAGIETEPGGMGQASALGSMDDFKVIEPRAEEFAPAPTGPPDTVLEPAREPARPGPAAPPRPPPMREPETFLAKFRRALFGS